MYLCYLYFSFCCNMMCVSHPVHMLVCNTFNFVLVVFVPWCLCVCFEIPSCLYLYAEISCDDYYTQKLLVKIISVLECHLIFCINSVKEYITCAYLIFVVIKCAYVFQVTWTYSSRHLQIHSILMMRQMMMMFPA
jgi:hypothetical protein